MDVCVYSLYHDLSRRVALRGVAGLLLSFHFQSLQPTELWVLAVALIDPSSYVSIRVLVMRLDLSLSDAL